MSLLSWATVVVFAVLLAAVAAVLLVIVALLWRTRATLDDVVEALTTVADGAEPLGPWIGEINQHLGPARDALAAAAPMSEAEQDERGASVSS